MALKEQILEDLKTAMKAKDKDRLQVLRSLKAKLQEKEIAERKDLAEKEKAELEIIEEYLPKMLTEDEVRELVSKKITELGAEGPQDMGKVMGPIMGMLKGKADGGLVSKVVKEELSN